MISETNKRRKSRRRMAWISLYAILIITGLLMFAVTESRLKEIQSMMDTVLFCLSSIVLGYQGTATWDSLNQMKHQKKCKEEESKSKVDNPDK